MTDAVIADLVPHRSNRALRMVLGVHQAGRLDPTTVAEPGGWWRATHTPAGPGTLHLWWAGGAVDAEAWGPGGEHLLARVSELLGDADSTAEEPIVAVHPAVAEAQRNHRHLRIGRSRDLWHAMLPTILEQRVTTGEARQSYRKLCFALGDPAPGPRPLRLPPTPASLANQPYWWFHRLGVERKRADAIRSLARHPVLLAGLDEQCDPIIAYEQLRLVPGIGVWTLGVALGSALGDPDAFAIGDYWLKHSVCHALAGEVRGTDERMIELLAPYAGQRGRVVRWLGADGWRPQRFGPGLRVMPIAKM